MPLSAMFALVGQMTLFRAEFVVACSCSHVGERSQSLSLSCFAGGPRPLPGLLFSGPLVASACCRPEIANAAIASRTRVCLKVAMLL